MKDDRLYLIHLSESIAKIELYTDGLNFASFMQNTLVQDAVLRNLQVLAESTQRLSENFKTHHPEVEWYKIAGLRNILSDCKTPRPSKKKVFLIFVTMPVTV